MAVSGGIGKPGSITSLNPGSSMTTTCRHAGSASATHWRTVRRCSRTARTATSKASAGGAPRRASARPEGHRSDHLPLDRTLTAGGGGRGRRAGRRTRRARDRAPPRPADRADRRRAPARRPRRWSHRGPRPSRGPGSARPASASGQRRDGGQVRLVEQHELRGCGGVDVRAGFPLPWPRPPAHGPSSRVPPFDALREPYCVSALRWRVGDAVGKSAQVDRVDVWVVRGLWLALPVTVGPAVGHALASASTPVRVVTSVGLWVLWTVGLVATLVPTTVSLTVVRLLSPAPVLVAAARAGRRSRLAGDRWRSPWRRPSRSRRSAVP